MYVYIYIVFSEQRSYTNLPISATLDSEFAIMHHRPLNNFSRIADVNEKCTVRDVTSKFVKNHVVADKLR